MKDGKKVIVVNDAKDGKTKGVTEVKKDGNIKTVDLTEANAANLLNVNTHDSPLEAFFKKLLQEADNPTHTGIYMMAEDALNKLIKTEFPAEELEKHRVDPAAELQKADGESLTFQPMDVEKIDRADLESKGIRWEDMEPHLRAMSYGHKSTSLVDMNPEMEFGMRVSTKGRISLEEQPDGSLKVIPHYWQEKPNLDIPLYGKKLDSESKANLELTGHAGKTIKLELTPGKKEPCFVSLDKMTNTLEVMRVADFPHRKNVKGVDLSKGQAIDLYDNGRKILLEKMTTRAGYFRDAHIQVDASNRNFAFSYDGLDRNRYAQENNEIRRQKTAEQRAGKKESAADDAKTNLTIHRRVKGAEVPENAYKQWTEAVNDPAKRQNVQAYYIKGMIDDKGQPFNAWVKPNFEKDKFDFHKFNPKYVKGKEVKPANESRTQVAVNNDGKTNEATRNVREPLRQGQQRPTGSQQKQHQQRQYRQSPPARRNSPPKAGEKQGGQKL